jgi:hypothetical protein
MVLSQCRGCPRGGGSTPKSGTLDEKIAARFSLKNRSLINPEKFSIAIVIAMKIFKSRFD